MNEAENIPLRFFLKKIIRDNDIVELLFRAYTVIVLFTSIIFFRHDILKTK